MLAGISLASILPGPMATNLVAYIGYKMARLKGAIIESLSVILPAFILILLLKEFIDGIALGQVTPGPIMISAAFIGYKFAGFWGALAATIAIFSPPCILMIISTRYMDFPGNSPLIKNTFQGFLAVIIGIIFSSVFFIGRSIDIHWLQITIAIIAFILSIRTRIEVSLIILASGLAGYLLM